MGCWNETCGISHMEITCGEKIRLLPIVMNPYHYNEVDNLDPSWKETAGTELPSGAPGCYITEFWTPFAYPIRGEYNDYGSIENIPNETEQDKAEQEQFVSQFKNLCSSVEMGENQYHDPAVKNFDIDEIIEGIREGRCYAKIGFRGTYVPIGWMMIKESVWQSLLEIDIKESGETWSHPSDKFDKYSLDGIRQSISAKLKTTEEIRQKEKFLDENRTIDDKNVKEMVEIAKSLLRLSSSFDREFERLRFWTNSPVRYEKGLNEHLVEVASECEYIFSMMNIMRINFAPTTGAGSQSSNYQLYKLVYDKWMNIILNEIAQREAEWGE